MLIGEIITYLQHKKGLDFISLNEEKCVEYVSEIAQPVFDFFRNASDEEIAGKFSRKFGEGGVKEYLYNLCEIIFGRFDDFGSEEFRTYITQKDSDEVVKSNQFIITLTEMMMDYVIDVLTPIIHDSLRIWTGRAGLAGLTAVFVGRFSRRLGVDVRGSSGGTGRVDQGPWAAMQPAIATRALR